MARSSYRRRRKMLLHYVLALAILAIAIVLMPFAMQLKERTMLLIYISGLFLWAGLIGSFAIAIHINRSRRQSPVFQELYPNAKRSGLTHFFQNKQATKADVALLGSLFALVLVCLVWSNQIAIFICIAFTVFSFGMHCMLNSINYVYINYRLRREKTS